MEKFDFLTDKSDQNSYFRVPMLLLSSDSIPKLPCEAILLYGIFLDVIGLSFENTDRFSDEEGRYYIIYPIEKICDTTGLKRKKVMGLMKQLEDASLISRMNTPGMGNTKRIYVGNYASMIKGDVQEEDFPYFYSKEEAESYSFMMIPYAMLRDPRLENLSLDAIFLYCLLLDRVRLSRINKEQYTDENGNVFIFFKIKTICSLLKVSTQKAVTLLESLDDAKGVGLVHKERVGNWNNANKLFIKEYVPLPIEKGDEEDKGTVKKVQKKPPEPLENEKVPILEHRKSQNQNIESPDFRTSDVPILEYQRSRDQNIESPDAGISKVPILEPNHINNNQPNKNNIEKPDLQKDSTHISQIIETERDDDTDSFSETSFADLFAKAIEFENICPDPDLATSQAEKMETEKARQFTTAIFTEAIRAVSFPDKVYKIDGLQLSTERIKRELLGMDCEMFLEAVQRMMNNGQKIVHWDSYILTVFLQVKRTFVLHKHNDIKVFEKWWENNK